MPKIIVQTNQADDSGRVTLTERVVATQLQDDHYSAQLVQRLAWAAGDAEQLEAHCDDERGPRMTRQHDRSLTGAAGGRRRGST
jgi:hypothetical protein